MVKCCGKCFGLAALVLSVVAALPLAAQVQTEVPAVIPNAKPVTSSASGYIRRRSRGIWKANRPIAT